MTTAWRKSIVRPLASVTRPSSRICSRIAATSAWAFSNSSKSTTQYGRRRTGSVKLPGFIVSGVPGRRAEQARDGVRLGVLGQVDAHERVVAAEQLRGQRSREFGLADAARADEQEAADGFARVFKPGAPAPNRFGRRARSRTVWPITRFSSALSSDSRSRVCSSADSEPCGMPVHRATTAATSSASTVKLPRSATEDDASSIKSIALSGRKRSTM